MALRVKGRISEWNDDKGYGFITPMSGGNRVFVHISAFRATVIINCIVLSWLHTASGRAALPGLLS